MIMHLQIFITLKQMIVMTNHNMHRKKVCGAFMTTNAVRRNAN